MRKNYMKISRHCEIEKDFKCLKKFPAARESLEAWERLFVSKGLKETPGVDSFVGFGDEKIFKGRVIPLKEKFGKSKGYRVIFQMIGECCKVIVFSRHGVYHDENDLLRLIRRRLSF